MDFILIALISFTSLGIFLSFLCSFIFRSIDLWLHEFNEYNYIRMKFTLFILFVMHHKCTVNNKASKHEILVHVKT